MSGFTPVDSAELWDSLLELSRRFLRASSEDEIVDALAEHLNSQLGFPHLVLYQLKVKREPPVAVVWKVRGEHPVVKSVPVEGDQILEEVLATTEPIVVADARTDPRTNKEVVEAKGCRTLVFLPMVLADGNRIFASTGTFGDQSWEPDPESLEYLANLGYHTALALDRIRISLEQEMLSAEVAHAEKMELLGRMAGSGAHELRNLLTTITGYTALVREQIEARSTAGKVVPKIERAAERATKVVKSLLAFSRRGEGSGDALSLNRVLKEMESMLGSLLDEGISFSLDLAPGLHKIKLRRSQLEQLLVHLVANASDALGDRGTLRIETRNAGPRFPQNSQPDWVTLAVSDDGPGLLPEVAERVFDPFFSTRAPSSHPGLGLSTCYGIVHQAGGHISIDTAPGRGTTVNVRFPAFTSTSGGPQNRGTTKRSAVVASSYSAALVALSRKLLKAQNFKAIVEAARVVIEEQLGLNKVWLYMASGEPPDAIEMWIAGGQEVMLPMKYPIAASRFVQDAMVCDDPIVIEDARTDPRTNKMTVSQTGSRSMLVVPFNLTDGRRAGLGTGTFFDEGTRTFRPRDVDFVVALTNLTGVALDRCRLLEERQSARSRFLRGQHLEAVSQLGRGLADDLRNALTGIDGFTHLAQDSLGATHPSQTNLAKIVEASQKASQLINKMVAFAGPEKTATADFDLNRLLHSLRPLLTQLARGREVEIATSQQACLVHADWGQIEQVVLNLIFNALESLGDEGKVCLRTESVGGVVVLEVEDNGVGMSEEVATLAFQPFFTTKPPHLGTGLGLPTCKRIVNESAGSISLASEPGLGTVVRVTFPISQDSSPNQHKAGTSSSH